MTYMGAHQSARSFRLQRARPSTATKTNLGAWGLSPECGIGPTLRPPRLVLRGWRCHTGDECRGLRASEGDKSMFSVGQKVWHRNGQRSGTVLECDGDRVFIAQDNGVEVDFRASDLTATPPTGSTASGARLTDSREATGSVGYMMPSRTLTSRDITPEHVR